MKNGNISKGQNRYIKKGYKVKWQRKKFESKVI